MKNRKILGIDPGYDRIGIAILEEKEDCPEVIYSECFSPKTKEFDERLFCIAEKVEEIIKKYNPEKIVIETLFFSKNKKTALRVAEIRGMLIYLSKKHKIPAQEVAPSQVKLTVAGYGAARKEDVERMVKQRVIMTDQKRLDDEIDAIAIGLTGLIL